jgi:hypothetical protein
MTKQVRPPWRNNRRKTVEGEERDSHQGPACTRLDLDVQSMKT